MIDAGVFFDLDGTIVDYERCVCEALGSLWRRFGLRTRATCEEFVATCVAVHRADEADHLAGRVAAAVLFDRASRFRRVLRRFGVEDPALAFELGEGYRAARRELAEVFPGARETLALLRSRQRIWLAVVTEGSPADQHRQLERLGLRELFHDVVVSDEVGLHKPDPALVGLALTRSGVAPRRAVFVGDRPVWDLVPAKRLGMGTVLIASERYERELAASRSYVDAVVADQVALSGWLSDWVERLDRPEEIDRTAHRPGTRGH
jgi:putative hydrolase of the HAD superfamily